MPTELFLGYSICFCSELLSHFTVLIFPLSKHIYRKLFHSDVTITRSPKFSFIFSLPKCKHFYFFFFSYRRPISKTSSYPELKISWNNLWILCLVLTHFKTFCRVVEIYLYYCPFTLTGERLTASDLVHIKFQQCKFMLADASWICSKGRRQWKFPAVSDSFLTGQ